MKKTYIIIILIAIFSSAIGFSMVSGLRGTADKLSTAETSTEKKVISKEKAFNAESFTLENGMRVVLIENHRTPIVSHMIWYDVGAADEDWGNSGIAHFFEHLMFKGTDTLAPGEYSKTVRALGGEDNAFTGQDYTAYFVNIAREELPTIMRMEADRMRNLNIPEEHFVSEKNVILEERAQRTDTNPTARMMETLRATLYPNHAYGVPIIGWREEIAALTYDEIMSFYKKWYAPNNAVLVVSGAITRAELEPLAKEYYGSIEAQPQAQSPDYKAPILPGHKKITYEDAQVQQPRFIRLCRMPSYATDKKSALALEIAANIIDGGAATRLYQALVSEGRLASSAHLSYSGFTAQESTASIAITPREGVSIDDVTTAFDAVLMDYKYKAPSDDEIQAAKDRMVNDAIYARDSLQAPAYIFGQALTTGLSIDDIEYWTYDIETTSNDDVRNAIDHFLNTDKCVDGALLPVGGAPAANQNAEGANHE
tara:strand:+ start:363 stop:1811 length:1449 start_codon:yes stop_codon:yes gene_type:complete